MYFWEFETACQSELPEMFALKYLQTTTGPWRLALFDVEIFSGSFNLFSLLRSDASKNMNTPERCFIVKTVVIILMESDTDTVLSYIKP